MSDSQHHSPSEPMSAIVEGLCDHCLYDLKSLPTHGTCPECGEAYTPSSMRPVIVSPSPVMLILSFGWPVMAMVLFATPVFLDNADPSPLCFALAFFALIPINSAIQAQSLVNHHFKDRWNNRPFTHRLRWLGAWAVAMFYLTLIGPLVIFGGCLVLVLSSM